MEIPSILRLLVQIQLKGETFNCPVPDCTRLFYTVTNQQQLSKGVGSLISCHQMVQWVVQLSQGWRFLYMGQSVLGQDTEFHI